MHLLQLAPLASFALGSAPWMDRADPPATRAAAILNEMTLAEKVAMLHGQRPSDDRAAAKSKSNYTGLIIGNARLNIPEIRMEDGPQGFRCGNDGFCQPGSTTAWPSGLTVAASFDKPLARRWGEAMGKEFRGKGANTQLGPGMCVARVPTNGRNFEYLSGE
jgi:beta-glucosidase